MLKYLLDTNIVVYVIKNRPQNARERFTRHQGQVDCSQHQRHAQQGLSRVRWRQQRKCDQRHHHHGGNAAVNLDQWGHSARTNNVR